MTINTQSRFDFANGGIKSPINVNINAHRIHSRNKLEKYLRGSHICKSVAYVIGLEKIASYIEDLNMKEFHVIIGKEVSAAKHRALDIELIEKLVKWESEGRLHIRVPLKNEMHEKFFFCWNHEEGWFKDINGSANPTARGSGSTQSNRIKVHKLEGDYQNDNFYLHCMEEWENYVAMSEPFFGSLLELLPEAEEEGKTTIVKWIESAGEIEAEDIEEIRILKQSVKEGLFESTIKGEPTFVMNLDPYTDSTVEKTMNELNALGFDIERAGSELFMPSTAMDLFHPPQKSAFPYMDFVDGKLWLRIGGKNICRTNDNLDSEAIKKELNFLDNYITSVGLANRGDLKAQMALAEFLLTGLNAPFEYRYMRERRTRFPRQKNGPRMTSYVGMAGNGKSYACRYLLRMLSNEHIEPMTSNSFTKKAVISSAQNGSCFPLIFDDLVKNRITDWGKWGKLYWDEGYVSGKTYAQLIVTANDHVDNSGPLGRRVREIPMHAAFISNEENSMAVETLLENASNIFPYFSALMIEEMDSGNSEWYVHSDELALARTVIKKLYLIAKMKMPEWWLDRPVERVNDDQAYQWLDLLNKRIVDFKIEGDEVIVQFHGDGSKWDARDKKNLLPTSVAPEAVGTKIRIRNPDIFVDWLQSASISYPLKLKREVKKLLRKKFHISR